MLFITASYSLTVNILTSSRHPASVVNSEYANFKQAFVVTS